MSLYYFNHYRGVLGEAYDGDIAFADSMEAFGSGHDDPISVSIGGCLISLSVNIFYGNFVLVVIDVI